jgi:uncharacterized cupredoxin-like copper-binding protein
MSRRRRLVTAVAVAAIAAGGIAAGAVPVIGAQAAKPKAPAHMLVYAQEWSLWPSRGTVPSGALDVQLWNRGEDAHDLRIRLLRHGRMTGRTQGVSVTQSGGISTATWHLSPGRYVLYCSMPGHYKKGMHTVIVVK